MNIFKGTSDDIEKFSRLNRPMWKQIYVETVYWFSPNIGTDFRCYKIQWTFVSWCHDSVHDSWQKVALKNALKDIRRGTRWLVLICFQIVGYLVVRLGGRWRRWQFGVFFGGVERVEQVSAATLTTARAFDGAGRRRQFGIDGRRRSRRLLFMRRRWMDDAQRLQRKPTPLPVTAFHREPVEEGSTNKEYGDR